MQIMGFATLLAMLLVQVAAQGTGFLPFTETPAVQPGFLERKDNNQLLALGSVQGQQVDELEQTARRVMPTFTAMPKNHFGRLAGPAVRYLVQTYFMKEHGWLIKGLEPHQNAPAPISAADAQPRSKSDFLARNQSKDVVANIELSLADAVPLLREKAPHYVETVIAPQEWQGLGLKDILAMLMLLEQLVLDEGLSTLESAYTLNSYDIHQPLFAKDVDEVMTSHLLLFALGDRRNAARLLNKTQHKAAKNWVKQIHNWQAREAQVKDLHQNFAYGRQSQANPFIALVFSFEDTSELMVQLNQKFGEFHDSECRSLKEGLAELGTSGAGRIPLGQFYAKKNVGYWHLVESAEYLRNQGALDETSPRGPQLIVANYMSAMSNCDAPSEFYSMCCIAEGQSLLNEIETQVQSSFAQPAQILELVSKLPSSTIDAGRNLSTELVSALYQVASIHDGQIPLHSRLFSQWLHFAYPLEVPYPHISTSIKPLTPAEYRHQRGRSDDAELEEMELHMAATPGLISGEITESMAMWTLEEELRAGSSKVASGNSSSFAFLGAMLQIAPFFLVLLGLSRSLVTAVRSRMAGPQLFKKGVKCQQQ